MMPLRSIKSILVFSVALLFSVIVFNNITDFSTNWDCLQHVLGMENIHNDLIAYRAIHNPVLLLSCYWLIIIWEALTAFFCWWGGFALLITHRTTVTMIGLTMGFLLFMVGFVVIGNEWFYLWQSNCGILQSKALLLALFLMTMMIFVQLPESYRPPSSKNQGKSAEDN